MLLQNYGRRSESGGKPSGTSLNSTWISREFALFRTGKPREGTRPTGQCNSHTASRNRIKIHIIRSQPHVCQLRYYKHHKALKIGDGGLLFAKSLGSSFSLGLKTEEAAAKI